MTLEMVLSVIQVIVCVVLVLTVLSQESPKGSSGALTGSGDTDSHYDKIRGRTGGVILKKFTIALGTLFVIITFAINIV